MGTNFYTNLGPCDHCGRGDETLHIGKSSFGWPFTVHVIPERDLNSWSDWHRFLEGRTIKDEYGEPVDLATLNRWIKSKREFANQPHAVEARRDHPRQFMLSPEGDHLSPGEFS